MSQSKNQIAAPQGLERRILRALPQIVAAGTILPLAFYWFFSSDPTPGNSLEMARYVHGLRITAASVIVIVWALAFTVAIGCYVVIVMKGPGYVADSYEVPDSETPQKISNQNSAAGSDSNGDNDDG